MTGAELVGPLPVVTFYGGPWDPAVSFREYLAASPKVAYTPPRNTLDPRYSACTDHHVACDCREAHFAEARAEARMEMENAQKVFNEILAGHDVYSSGRRPGCMCTGCQIARHIAPWISTAWHETEVPF